MSTRYSQGDVGWQKTGKEDWKSEDQFLRNSCPRGQTEVVTRKGNGTKTGRNGSMFSRLCTDRRVKDSHWAECP